MLARSANHSSLRNVKLWLLPIFLLLAVTLPHLDQGEFRRDTVKYAAVGHYMWNGGSLLVPHLGPEKPYFNKPPLALWIHGLFLTVFGMNLAAARLPSIIAAAGVIVFSMLALRKLGTRREAIVSGIVLALTYEFFRRTREISMDFWQLFFVMIAVWMITAAIRENRGTLIGWAGAPLGLALMCKPLVALFVFPIAALWVVLADRARLMRWLVGATLPLAVAVALPWHLYMYAHFGDAFLHRYFARDLMEVPARSEQRNVPLYYITQNLQTYWPWLLALLYAAYLAITKRWKWPARTRHRRFVTLAAVWVTLCLIALSCFGQKKPNYALPLYPMLAWICAWALCRISWPSLRTWYRRGLPGVAPAAVATCIVAVFAPIRFQEPGEKNWVALIEWINTNKIDSSQLGYAKLELNDLSYVYVKTGGWMKSLPAAEADPNWRAGRRLVVTKIRNKPNPLAAQNPAVFSSGPVRVITLPSQL